MEKRGEQLYGGRIAPDATRLPFPSPGTPCPSQTTEKYLYVRGASPVNLARSLREGACLASTDLLGRDIGLKQLFVLFVYSLSLKECVAIK